MALRTYLNRIRRLDAMIRRKNTGPPEQLAQKLGISERWLYKFLRELREEFNCPIKYDYYRQSYVYEKRGRIMMGFKNLSHEQMKKISGGKSEIKCIYLFTNEYLCINKTNILVTK